MAIKNYTSDKPIERIFAELQQTLGTHGAKQISFDYGDDGKVHDVQFVIKVNDRFIPVKLPARVEQAQAVLERQYKSGVIKSHIGTKVYSGRTFQFGEGWHSNENAVRFWTPSPRVPKEADARCYAALIY